MRRVALLVAAAGLVGGCDLWFGEAEDPPLPGERISVMVHQGTLTPDSEADTGSIVLPRPARNPEWPQPGGYANHAMHHLELSASPERVWRADVGSSTDDDQPQLAPPVIANNRIFVMDAAHVVRALDATTGEIVWKADLASDEDDDDVIVGGIAYEDGRIFATTGFAKVFALDAATGNEVWQRKIGIPMHAAPTVRGNRVFAITVGNTLHALNAFNGEELWSYSAISELANLLGGASPAVDSGVVVAPFSSGELVALTVENGRVLWNDTLTSRSRQTDLDTLPQIRGRPVIDRGRVFAVSHGGVTAAIDLGSGTRLWDKEVGGIDSPWVAGDFLFLITNDGQLVCLSSDSGSVLWVTDLPVFEDEEDRDDPIIWSGPVLVGDRLIIAGSNRQALSVSPYTGRILGVQDMSDSVSVAPVVADGTLFLLSDDAELVAYR